MSRLWTLVIGILIGGIAVAALYHVGVLRPGSSRVVSAPAQPGVASSDRGLAKVDDAAWPPPADEKPSPVTASAPTAAQAPATPVLGTHGVDPAGPESARAGDPLPGTGDAADATSSADVGGVFAASPPAPSQPLLLPVAGVKAAQLVDTYTQSRGAGRSHDAIDIMAPRGTPVYAVEDGRVAKLFLSKPGGITVYQFDPSERLAYYYAHLDGYADGIVEGKQVKRGDLIGYVGSTGNADPNGPHLHFAIFALGPEKSWWQGTAINPYPLLGGLPH